MFSGEWPHVKLSGHIHRDYSRENVSGMKSPSQLLTARISHGRMVGISPLVNECAMLEESRLFGNLDFRAHLGLYTAEVFARNRGFSSNLGAEKVLSCHWLINKSAFTSAAGTVPKIRIIKVADFMEQLRGES
jgi:hypothetical protein